jgi:hypothetical protein
MPRKEYTMHFDYCIQNPPYDRNLHLQVLEQTLKVADTVVNISPVRWLQDPFAPYSTRSDYCKFEESISRKIESLDVIPAKDASKLFDAAFTMNLGIYICSDKGGYAYQHNDPLITKVVEKTLENNWEPFSWRKEQVEKPYKLICPAIMGAMCADGEHFERLLSLTYEKQLQAKPTNPNWKPGGHDNRVFYFDTEAERRNFYDCYNHPFMKWHTRLWKIDVSIQHRKVPYFSDYTHPWTFKDFFTWFDLTKAEQSRVIQEIRQMRHAKFH